MIRENLVAWQWQDYCEKHAGRVNLIIHLVAVPLFWLAAVEVLKGAFFAGGIGLIISFVMQAVGHRTEKSTPAPFLGPLDFISRFLTEQFISFPRFLLQGHWLRSFKA